METLFECLQWDSELFGFPVARLRPIALRRGVLDPALESLKTSGFRLAYAATPWLNEEGRRTAEIAGGLCVDRKTTFHRDFQPRSLSNSPIVAFQGSEASPELEALALAAGQFSRFVADPRVRPEVFRDLYLAWIRRSVKHEIADEVLVALEGEIPVGMITLRIRDAYAEIGLVAVDATHRGRGLGHKLMEASEQWAGERGVYKLRVVTQGANESACALYRSCGYALEDEQAFYHFWIGDPSEEVAR